jgi:hypothetical protein
VTVADNREKAIEKLQEVIDTYEKDRFDADELVILHRMIDLWKAFEVLGKVANFGRGVVIWVAGFTLLWFTPFEQIVKVIKKYFGAG